jgi:hypothetical protein
MRFSVATAKERVTLVVYGEIGTVLIALAGDPLTTLELIAR